MDKKQKDRTCNHNCKDICGECQVMVFKKQTAVDKWLAKQDRFALIRTSRNYQRECQMCLNILKQRNI